MHFVKTLRCWLRPLLQYQALTLHLSEFHCASCVEVIDGATVSSCILQAKWPKLLFSHLTQALNGLIGSIRVPYMKVLSNSPFRQPSLAYWDCK